ncbi:glycosyltransferase family 2 protein [Nitrosopumilus sp. S6]
METKIPLISIVITNFNGGDLLLECLETVFKTNYNNFEVILVDNCSDDNSHNIAKERFPRISLIENNENLGAVGRNSGIKNAKGDFIVLLDNDTKVDSEWLNEFLKSYEKFGYGMYQGKLLLMDSPEKINSAGCMINIFGFSFAKGTGEIDKGQYDHEIEINFPATACAFVPKKIFEEIGYFDEKFFAYLDDTDFGWRAMKQNISSYFVPSAIVFHKWSNTTKWSPLKYYLLERNRQICINTLFSEKSLSKLKPFLKIVDYGITKLYEKNGMLDEKRKADEFIKNNKQYLDKKSDMVRSNTIISDKEIIKKFSDEVPVPKESIGNQGMLNRVLSVNSKVAKSII